MSTQEQRERFEVWCDSDGINAERSAATGVYSSPPARVAWRAWKAAEAAAIERCAKRVERAPLDLFGMPPEMRITARAHVADDLRALLPKEES